MNLDFQFFQSITNEEYGQCIMYVTTLGIVRNTKARCSSVRKILRNLSVRSYIEQYFDAFKHVYGIQGLRERCLHVS